MLLTPLQIISIIAGFVFVIFAIDSWQRKKFNALHFVVFFGGSSLLIVFSYDIHLLNKFGALFGIARGADLIVYMAIIFLAYLYFELLNKITRHSMNQTKLVGNQAIAKFYNHNKDFFEKNKNLETFILVRAYNEGKEIRKTISELIKTSYKNILIVNDGSSDNTEDEVNQAISENTDSNIILISHLVNRGGGAANKTGFDFFKKYGDLLGVKFVITFDADGQMKSEEIKNFLKEVKTGNFDVVLGSRFIKGGKALGIPLLRRIVLFGSKLVTLVFNGKWFSDPHNGFRLLTLNAINKINITSDNMTYASELLDEIKLNNLKFSEIPVKIEYSEYSLGKGQKNSNAIKILLELLYRKFFYK